MGDRAQGVADMLIQGYLYKPKATEFAGVIRLAIEEAVSGDATLDPRMVDAVVEAVIARLADDVVREIAREVVPRVAETVVRERIRELEREDR